MPSAPRPRPTGRILLVNAKDQVLLFSARVGHDPGTTMWFTPGGGVGHDEPVAVAAARELAEETGHKVSPGSLGPVVAVSSGVWEDGDAVFHAFNSYFFVRVGDLQVDTSGQEALERSVITGHRWWGLADLEESSDLIYPAGLAGLLRRLLTEGPPPEPVVLPWRDDR